MRRVIVYVDHEGGISRYGPYESHTEATNALRRRGWNDRFSTVEGQWLPRTGTGTDRTYATIELLEDQPLSPPDRLPGRR